MARTRTISDEQILEAALEVFLERGPQGTTAEIARRAGISEGTIFRRYDTKEELFIAAMSSWSGPDWLGLLEEMQGKGELEENLLRLAEAMLGFYEEMIPRISLSISCGEHIGELFRRLTGEPPVIKAIKKLTAYFAAEQALGRVAAGDPEIMARIFMSTCFQQANFKHLQWNDWLPMPRQTFLRGVVNLLLRGVAPRGSQK